MTATSCAKTGVEAGRCAFGSGAFANLMLLGAILGVRDADRADLADFETAMFRRIRSKSSVLDIVKRKVRPSPPFGAIRDVPTDC